MKRREQLGLDGDFAVTADLPLRGVATSGWRGRSFSLGIADAVLRGAWKGGKSTGVVENILTDEAIAHPWFSRFAEALPDGRRLFALDNRLYDLVPKGPLPPGVVAISYEALGKGGPAGDALTMMEVARDEAGVMPRVFGVNHHPEIVNRANTPKRKSDI